MRRASAPGHDLFKLIVTLVLALILLLMLLRGCATTPLSSLPMESVAVSTATERVSPSGTSSPIPPTDDEPTSTPLWDSALPSSTSAPAETPTPAPTQPATTVSGQNQSCNTSAPSRISAGLRAQVLRNLNLRQDPSITSPIVKTNKTGKTVEIIGGPVCTPQGDHAYLWWNIRLDDGLEGWSAETPLKETAYFLEPLP